MLSGTTASKTFRLNLRYWVRVILPSVVFTLHVGRALFRRNDRYAIKSQILDLCGWLSAIVLWVN